MKVSGENTYLLLSAHAVVSYQHLRWSWQC